MKIALGVSGGIAAYKAAELVRLFQERGLDVQVVMTRNACEFVTPLTFASLSGNHVITEMFGASRGEANLESAIEHIAVAQGIDALVVAPATADLLGKLAHGLADDFLTTLALATPAPLIVCPAMNVQMWENAATRANVAVLRERGVTVVEPEEGALACGMLGPGRLAALEAITEQVYRTLGWRDDLKGQTVLVTAGPTCEDIDPVRFLSNRSSGKMGYAVAEAGLRRGARAVLISGPTNLTPPSGAEVEHVRSAEEMEKAVFGRLQEATVVVMAAAVADYRPVKAEGRKIKKSAGRLELALEPTGDILKKLAGKRNGQIVVGFAAETDHLLENAKAKLKEKKLDLVAVNDVTEPGSGFDADTNRVTLIARDGTLRELGMLSKLDVAHRVLDEVVRLRAGKRS
ncbi:MAG: bifunctional phosphopantothenoylcysteine decarboxylase/phosphopantothenate--cysteine ligase CoaBC [Acidobacteria bacterium]|nr:bifunctional phosphopantothenoylcysteine decarboxylase/phosphopantothenate--cysteine ligase CoaBC [Acidobacteriota bacterium]